ncbi:pyridine nucleotide-disulfide oxidoreductase [Christensenellaceae bacterium]|nr:pyridine nucleotide-disulfide oxidoreductase [Christensenellaceae bacterium]BDF60235.1 pyridine nucleotide-disulfide oxidoreductase [Christensenellaceae bacterium]
MKTIQESAREIPLLCEEMDVIVIGGGAAGIGAALAAARNGAKTIIIERFGFFGGSQTAAFDDSFAWVDDRIQGGIVQEIMDDIIAAGMNHKNSPGQVRDHWANEFGSIFFDGEYYKYLVDNLMEKAGVKVVFHALAADAIVNGDSLKGVIIESLEGRQAVLGKTIIDCTGIAHIAWKSGASVTGENGYPDNRFGPYEGYHMGLGYGFFVRNIDYYKFREFAEANPEQWDYWVKGMELFTKARAEGKLYSPRNSCLLTEYEDGRAWIINPYYKLEKGQHPWQVEVVSHAEKDMRKQAWSCWELLKDNVPGFENSRIEQTPSCALLRDGHRIIGEYTLTEEDMYGARTFEDSVSICNMPPDLFFPDGSHHFKFNVTPYDIPYRCLVSKDFDNLLAAGGTSSLDFITWGAIRYCTPSLTTGQAAGTAAAIAVKDGVAPAKVDVSKVQKQLNKQGMLTTNKQVAPEVVAEYARRAEEWGDGFKISE